MPRKRLIIGQRSPGIPAGTINGMMDDIDRLEIRGGVPPGFGQWATVDGSPCLVCLAKNTSESGDLVERAPAKVIQSALVLPDITEASGGDPEINLADSVVLGPPAIEIEPVDSSTTNWVITLAPIPAGQTGLVALMGLVAARVNVTDAAHEFATFDSTDTIYLKSATSGAAIWDRKKKDVPEAPGADPPTTPKGKQWALILLGGGGGEGGGLTTGFGICTSDCGPATSHDPADWGSGSFKPKYLDGTFGAEATFYNISADEIVTGQVFPYTKVDGQVIALPPFCNLMSVP
jgi:hypothetical protein